MIAAKITVDTKRISQTLFFQLSCRRVSSKEICKLLFHKRTPREFSLVNPTDSTKFSLFFLSFSQILEWNDENLYKPRFLYLDVWEQSRLSCFSVLLCREIHGQKSNVNATMCISFRSKMKIKKIHWSH